MVALNELSIFITLCDSLVNAMHSSADQLVGDKQ